MEVRCQCGAVSFKTPLPRPLSLYICHCHECRRQTSSAFSASAIFPRFPLPDAELLSCYTCVCRGRDLDLNRPTSTGKTLYCYFCKNCGTRLIHTTPDKNVVSVKGGCIKDLDWKSAIHIWTKVAMVPIPEGCESYPGPAPDSSNGYGSSQSELDQPDEPGKLTGSGGSEKDYDESGAERV